jgi:hypothetical protein
MSKSTVTRLFVGSIIAVFAGLILGFGAVLFAFASDSLLMDGPDVVGIASTGQAWAAVLVVAIAMFGIVAGAVTGLVAWIGALLNTAQLDDKTWFVVLLVLGLFSFGLLAMIVYVVAGPDGTVRRVSPEAAPGHI